MVNVTWCGRRSEEVRGGLRRSEEEGECSSAQAGRGDEYVVFVVLVTE